MAVFYREWEDERELYRLKRAISWAFGGKEESRECRHEGGFDPIPGGGLKCKDCGEIGN